MPITSRKTNMKNRTSPFQIGTTHLLNGYFFHCHVALLGTNISPEKSILKMIFLFPRWDMLISWRVVFPKRAPFPARNLTDKISGWELLLLLTARNWDRCWQMTRWPRIRVLFLGKWPPKKIHFWGELSTCGSVGWKKQTKHVFF